MIVESKEPEPAENLEVLGAGMRLPRVQDIQRRPQGIATTTASYEGTVTLSTFRCEAKVAHACPRRLFLE
jgi:hypothetical protein